MPENILREGREVPYVRFGKQIFHWQPAPPAAVVRDPYEGPAGPYAEDLIFIDCTASYPVILIIR